MTASDTSSQPPPHGSAHPSSPPSRPSSRPSSDDRPSKGAGGDTAAPHRASASDDDRLAVLSTALERLSGWLRRTAPRSEHGLVAMATLDMVATGGPARISDLAAWQSISQPGMTKVVTRLAQHGLVERRADPADGRATLVVATDRGRAELDARHAVREAVLAERVRSLPPEQQRRLLEAADALAALIAPETRPSGDPDPGDGPGDNCPIPNNEDGTA